MPPVTTARPTFDQLSELPVSHTLLVPPEYEDHNGHLNIAHYLTTASWGVEYALRDAGMPADWPVTERLGVFTAEHHLVYLHEVMVGARLTARVRFLARSARGLHTQAYLLDETQGRHAYSMELMTLHVDLATRRTRPWPEALAASLDAKVAEHAALDWSAPVSGCLAVR